MVSAAHFGASVSVYSMGFHKKRNLGNHHNYTFGLSMSCLASLLLCVVVSNERVAFSGLTGKTEINGWKLGTKLVAYAQKS